MRLPFANTLQSFLSPKRECAVGDVGIRQIYLTMLLELNEIPYLMYSKVTNLQQLIIYYIIILFGIRQIWSQILPCFLTSCATLHDLHSHSKSQLSYLQMGYNLPSRVVVFSFILTHLSEQCSHLSSCSGPKPRSHR